MSTGKHIVLTGVNKIEVWDSPLPEIKDDGILLGIGLAGVCGTDKHIINNADKRPLPMGLGHEVTGTILKMGKKALENMYCNDSLKEGDRIALYAALPCGRCWWDQEFGMNHTLICDHNLPGYFKSPDNPPYFVAGWGEYMYIQPQSWLWKIPDHLSFEEAVLVEPFSMGIRAVDKAMTLPAWKNMHKLAFDGVAVVVGTGAVGILTSIALKIAGAGKVILVGGPQYLLDKAKSLGFADKVVNVFNTSREERVQYVMDESINGKGADVVFNVVGIPKMFIESLEMVRRLGTVVEAGNLIDDGTEVNINIARNIVRKDLALFGVISQPPQDLGKALRALSNFSNRFDFKELISKTYDIVDAQKILEDDPHNKVGIKTVFKGKGYEV